MSQTEPGPKTARKAVVSFALGLLSVVIWPCAIPALLFGHKARREVKNRPHELKGLKLATAGLFVAYLVLGFLVLFFLVLIVPALPKGYKASQALAALDQIRTVQSALEKYAKSRKGSYPESLERLAESGLIPHKELRAKASGYNFSYLPGEIRTEPHTGRRVIVTYALRADPRGILKFIPGAHHFYADQTGVIRYHVGRPADGQSPQVR